MVTGMQLPLAYGDGVSDSNCIVPECGIPVVSLGPGGGNIHSSDEWVEIDEMKHVTEVYLRYLFSERRCEDVGIR